MQVNNVKKENQLCFKMQYTKNTVKTLKKFVPELTVNNEFEYSKKALELLIKAKKRNDGLLLDITEDEFGFGHFDFLVKHANNKSSIFKRPVLAPSNSKDKTPAENFLKYAEFINSIDFVKESNRVLFQHYSRESKLSTCKKFKENFFRITKLDEWWKELLEDIYIAFHGGTMVILRPNGSSKIAKGVAYLKETVKEMISPTKTPPPPFQVLQKERQNTLSSLIDELKDGSMW